MIEVPVNETVRVLIPSKADSGFPNRFFISRSDAFLVMCSQCGGLVNSVYHVLLGESMLPMMSTCTCHEKKEQQ
jgi:hypothetical protein